MTRSELIVRLQEKHPELRGHDIESSVRLILDAIGGSLAHGDRVEIRGFGSFNVRNRPPRTARNPRTGEPVEVPPRYVPSFKPGKEMRERIDHERSSSSSRRALSSVSRESLGAPRAP